MGLCRFAAFGAAAQLVLLAFCANASASDACPTDTNRPTLATASDAAMAIVCDINQVRAQQGLPTLNPDTRLWSAAQWMANDMAARHYAAHVTPDGVDLAGRVDPTGYIPTSDAPWSLAENLGWGTNTLSTPQATVAGWMNSAPHRANILDPDLQDIGVGIAQGAITIGGDSGMIYVADFGMRGAPGTATAPAPSTAPVVRRRGRAARHRHRASFHRHHVLHSRSGRR